MDDGIERIGGRESGTDRERAVQTFRDVLDGDLVAERDVLCEMNGRRLIPARDEHLPPALETFPDVAVPVNQQQRPFRHNPPEGNNLLKSPAVQEDFSLTICRTFPSLQRPSRLV